MGHENRSPSRPPEAGFVRAGGAMRDTELDTAIAEHWRTMRRIQARAPLAVVLAVRARMDMLIDRRRS